MNWCGTPPGSRGRRPRQLADRQHVAGGAQLAGATSRARHLAAGTTVACPSTTCMTSTVRSWYSTSPGACAAAGVDLVAALVEQQPAARELARDAPPPAGATARPVARAAAASAAPGAELGELVVLGGRRGAAHADRADHLAVVHDRDAALQRHRARQVQRRGTAVRTPGPRSPCSAGGRSPRCAPCRSRRRRSRPARRRAAR